MLLLVTVGLVLAGIVLLVIGLIQDAPGYIYISMGCAVVAAITLFIFTRLTRREGRPATAGAGGDAPAAGTEPEAGGADRGATSETTPESSERGDEQPEKAGAEASGAASDGPAWWTDPHDDDRTDEAVTGSRSGTARPEPADNTDVVPVAGRRVADEDPGATTAEPAAAREHGAGSGDVDDEDHEGFDDEGDLHQPVSRAGAEAAAGGGTTAAAGSGWAERGWDDDWEDDIVFPIEDYDDLRVAEILPILIELEPDELTDVRDRESAGKARGTILRRIDVLLGTEEPVTGAPAAESEAQQPVAAAGSLPEAGPVGVGDGGGEPIPNYASLRVAQILPLLADLDDAELERVDATERAGLNRTTVLTRITRLRSGKVAVGRATPAKPDTTAGQTGAGGSSAMAREVAAARARSANPAKKATPAKKSTKKATPAKRAPGRSAGAESSDPAATGGDAGAGPTAAGGDADAETGAPAKRTPQKRSGS